MVMHARKQPRLTDGCNERRDYQSYQTLKYQSKSHSANEHRHDKLHNSSDQTPPSKMLRRSDSPDSKRGDGDGRTPHANRPKESSTSSSPHENSVNHGHHSANSHPLPPKCAEMRDPADDWSEHISSSGKKYYYNCRTEVSQWEKPKEWLEREQRQKEASKAVVVNSFPKDRDYRQEAMQAAAATAVTAMKPAPSEKASSHCTFTQASCSTSGGLNVSNTPGSSTSSSSHSSALLQDPALLRQLLPALQATLHINNSSVDMAKINEAQQPSQSPISVTPDASSPKSCLVSPRVSTPQTNSMASKPLPNASSLPTQIKVSDSAVKSALQHSSDKAPDVEDPRLQRQNSQGPLSSGPNGCLLNNSAPACPPTTFSPSLALHFNENLIRHVQSWPSDHVEKQAARLREEVHNMGSMNMSEICVELKKLRSLVRVCEIQATLREQRILFLRQEIKELEKLKNQNSFMV
ncbi:WW domain containing adaptor with coiled-coil b isoform X2 [Hemibagrus wyckioides]|uniref:WW domain containing adaptor with coiled-coil b isoform X2 n=1 Tax=Hemibagrus wyckioides TaxID=337641 RepID=UPI00266BEDEC|nr:WW domain containing adaptor with coiled-coil b isoform X2 [Hemibagrus wyckioides]